MANQTRRLVRRRGWQPMIGALVATALGLASTGCATAGTGGRDAVAQARLAVDQRLAGRWRLLSFVPESELTPALSALLTFQYERLVVVFERGRLRSESPTLTFDRAYRIEDPQAIPFRVVLTDEQGVGYDTLCSFDEAGRLLFQSISDPWKGRGVLEREGAGLVGGP